MTRGHEKVWGDAMDSVRDEIAGRLGTVGVFVNALGSATAASARLAAANLEALGYGTAWINDSMFGKEAFVHAGILLAATEQLMLATAVANIYARDPLAMVLSSNALAEAHDGRLVVGIGVSHAPAVQKRGHVFEKPLAAMRAYLDAMDAAVYHPPAPKTPVRRLLGALRPGMLGLARDRTDGVVSLMVTPEHTAGARAILGATSTLAVVQGYILESDPTQARAKARAFIAPYLAMPNYRNNALAMGFGEGELADGCSDRVVDALVAWGDVDAVGERVRSHLAAGADHVALQPATNDLGEAEAELRALADVVLAR